MEDDLWKRNSMNKDLNGKQIQRKMTSMKDDLNGRHPQWKTASMEDSLNGRWLQLKTTSREDHLYGSLSLSLVQARASSTKFRSERINYIKYIRYIENIFQEKCQIWTQDPRKHSNISSCAHQTSFTVSASYPLLNTLGIVLNTLEIIA